MSFSEPNCGDWSVSAPFRISRQMVDEIVDHLRTALPHEGCGLVGAVFTDDALHARRFFPGENIDHSATRFTMEPSQVIGAFKSMREEGLELGAIVHSHPVSPAEPSPTDLRETYYPDALSVIVSFREEQPELRAWRWFTESGHLQFRGCDVEVYDDRSPAWSGE